jgi:hypothetical protein
MRGEGGGAEEGVAGAEEGVAGAEEGFAAFVRERGITI